MEYDDRLTITTPEGVDLSLTLAGVGSRFVAALVDLLLQTGLLVAYNVLVGKAVGSLALAAVGSFLIFWGYDVFFEVLASGRTPGKRWNGLRVVRMGGEPIGFLASAIRNVLRVVDWLPFAYLVGVAAVLMTARNQRVGDVVAGTLVIRERRASRDAPHLEPRRASVPQEALAWDTSAVSEEEVAAVRSFLERRHEIDVGARVELAATLEARLRPKVAGVSDACRDERFLEALAAIKAARG